MLPPVDPEVLSTNPQFEALLQDLSSNALNPDGSSKLDSKAQKERDALTEDLRKIRIEGAKRDLVSSGLEFLSYNGDGLPDELQELVSVIAVLLEGRVSESDRELLQDDMEKFKRNIRPIAAALTRYLDRTAATVATLLDPVDPPAPSGLASGIERLQSSVSADRSAVDHARLTLATRAVDLHALYRRCVEACVRILERTIQGAVARGSRAKAEYLAQVAEGMARKLELQHAQLRQRVYTAEVQEALDRRREEIEREMAGARRKVREGERKLEEYKSDPHASKLAGEYAEIMREMEKVRGEIRRVEGV